MKAAATAPMTMAHADTHVARMTAGRRAVGGRDPGQQRRAKDDQRCKHVECHQQRHARLVELVDQGSEVDHRHHCAGEQPRSHVARTHLRPGANPAGNAVRAGPVASTALGGFVRAGTALMACAPPGAAAADATVAIDPARRRHGQRERSLGSIQRREPRPGVRQADAAAAAGRKSPHRCRRSR